jgi:chromosomal replication initiation ATPase DnaA
MASERLISTVFCVVTSALGVSVEDLFFERGPRYVEARLMAYLLARDFAQCSVKEFAQAMGRDPSGLNVGVKKFEARLRNEPHLAVRLEDLRQRLEEVRHAPKIEDVGS